MEYITILTGIRPTSNKLHIGHYALLNFIVKFTKEILEKEEKKIILYVYIADLHAIIQFEDKKKTEILKNLRKNVESIKEEAISHLQKHLWKYKDIKIFATIQSKYKNYVLPLKQLIENFISYADINSIGSIKEAKEIYGKSKNVNIYLPQSFYNYPLLQIADIIIHNPDFVIVGKDQLGNLSIMNKVINKIKMFVPEEYFNEEISLKQPYTNKVITLAEVKTPEVVYFENIIPGFDGRKMSKSYGNTLDIHTPKKEFTEQFLKYPTDGHRIDQPGDYTKCLAFKVFESLVIKEEEVKEIKNFCKTLGSKCKDCKILMANKIYENNKIK